MLFGLQWYWWIVVIIILIVAMPIKVKFIKWLSRKDDNEKVRR